MKLCTILQPLFLSNTGALPDQMVHFPRFSYTGSRFRLFSWIQDTFQELDFKTAIDAFAGSAVVSRLLKDLGKIPTW